MYNILMHLYELVVIIYSFFNKKVKKMWDGERIAVRTLREKVDQTRSIYGSMPPRSESLSRGVRSSNRFATTTLSTRFC